ncbi:MULTISPECIES: amino acid ABC transporter permease [Paraburkholderia]|jgi:amine acid ABC transporter, permease protein, 3-TM region, His/Glu/Gln/Arg/opine family|uniref:ABC transporter permease subunit n=2 Tax=Paraburkholderia TaxID=1822464 RepID=A0A6N6WLF9_9BURK|nr:MULTISPECIES: amino acid ABC transporter permease [Paraburkholderia]KPD19823.1 amino acid ABC transporter [Burkholderia sp. ST111]MBK5147483.1 amino acid ABC transporter permease [Burkholderia sp. R-69608]MCP2088967.1 polar amino acid transport system permease protein [Paraburkholderia sediminicola]KAE8760240.1 ABC transporter permease subunit [Paraburkholderia madseniana]MBK3739703.1 amino acid ABC transporter permease [Paraburkholderia aspalathi]
MFASSHAEIAQLFSFYNLLLLVEGFAATFVLSAAGCFTGFLAGFVIAIVRVTHSRTMAPLRALAFVYCFLFRRIPFLVTLMLVFFASQTSKANLSTFAVASLSVCLIASAYLGEIIRSGLESVHKNQWEAAQTLNFSYFESLRFVIVPQAWRVIVPPTFGFFVMFIKDTALASQIGVMELTSAGKVLTNKGFSSWLVYGTVLVLYFVMSYPLSRLGKRLEKKLAATRNR